MIRQAGRPRRYVDAPRGVVFATMTESVPEPEPIVVEGEGRAKIRGRAFYESIGSPKYIVAPMVDQSEFVSVFSFHTVGRAMD